MPMKITTVWRWKCESTTCSKPDGSVITVMTADSDTVVPNKEDICDGLDNTVMGMWMSKQERT